MMAENIRLTVIIPTRDRADTLVHTLRTITTQINPYIEIIVSDNFSGPEVKQVVEAVKDKRLRYIRTPERIGMSEHWEFAIEHAKGSWVTIIGDDDGLLPGAIERFFELSSKHPEIKAITGANCFYRWPTEDGPPVIKLISGKSYEIRNGREYLKRTMFGEIAALPTIYTGGFIHKDIINQLKELSPDGKFFQSMVPDVYSGIAVSSIIDKYIYNWQPWGIAGASKHSNGTHHRNKSEAEVKKLAYYTESKLQFLESLGDGHCIESMQIIMYESFLKSEHLRKYDIGVNLANQLGISMATSTKGNKERVFEYCRVMAEKNAIPFEQILKAMKAKKLVSKVKKLGRKVVRRIPGMGRSSRKVIECPLITNVYDAGQEIVKIQRQA